MPGARCDLRCSCLAAEGTGGGSLMQQPSYGAVRLLRHVPGPSFCPSGCLTGSPLPPCLVVPRQRGCNSSKSTLQNIITAHMAGKEQFAASEHRLGFDFGLAVVDSLSLLPVLAAFPAHVEAYAIGQASHRQKPSLFHQIDMWGFSTQFLLIFQANFAFLLRVVL